MIRLSRAAETTLLAIMLSAFLVVSLLLLSQKGLFIDDSMHMPAGYSYLLTHDFRLNQEHPPLIKLLSGSGLWRLHPRFPFESPGWQKAATPEDPEDGMVQIEEAFFDANADQFEQIAWYGRLPMLIIPLLLLLAVWWSARQMFGPLAGLIAVFLIATEPNVIGNSIVVQNDVAAALALLLFVIALKMFLADVAAARTRAGRALVLGGALGIGLVTKYSLVILAPVALAIVFVGAVLQIIRKRSPALSVLLSSLLVFLTAYLILLAFYAFHVDRIDADEGARIAGWFYLTGNAAEVFKRFVMWLPPLLPRYFVYGIDMVVQDSRDGRPAFLLGAVSDSGWWYYFPVAFTLKTTIPFLVTSVCGLLWAVFSLVRRKRFVLLYAILPAVLYLALTMTSHLNIGIRHLLPMFAFVAILGAGLISSVLQYVLVASGVKRARLLAIVIALLTLGPALLIAISTFPNYLTYFSPLAGGVDRGWQNLSDSNVETGQDVKPLATYLKAHGENRVTGIMVGGEFLKFYGVALEEFQGWEDDDDSDDEDSDEESSNNVSSVDTKYVAIGAWYLSEIDLSDKQKEIIDVYRQQKPEAMVGNSIFVFRRK
jgi:hypothetical protein